MRTEELKQATSNFIRTHNNWVDNNNQEHIPADYESSVEEMLATWGDGDIPNACRELAEAVGGLRKEWDAFQGYRSLQRQDPKGTFWTAVEAVDHALAGASVEEACMIEPVHVLRNQKVSDNQIAFHIYGYNGVGPFLKDGRVRADLIDKEASEPGSVIGKGWVHPLDAERQLEQQELKGRRLARTRDLAKTHADAPETVDELLLQNVSIQQICKMKGVSRDEVVARARELGTKAVETVPITAPAPTALAEDDDYDSDDGREDEPATSALDSQILEYASQGLSSVDIAKKMDLKVQKVSAVIREFNKRNSA